MSRPITRTRPQNTATSPVAVQQPTPAPYSNPYQNRFNRSNQKGATQEQTNATSQQPSSITPEQSPQPIKRVPIARTRQEPAKVQAPGSYLSPANKFSKIQEPQPEAPKPSPRPVRRLNPSQLIGPPSTIQVQTVEKTPQPEKIVTPKNIPVSRTIPKKVQKTPQPVAETVPTVLLKKSSVIALVSARLVRSRVVDGFTRLHNNKKTQKIKQLNQTKLLANAAASLSSSYLASCYHQPMRRLKLIYVKKLNQQSQQKGQGSQTLKHKETLARLLQWIFRKTIKNSFQSLGLKQFALNRTKNMTVLLDQLTRKKTKDAFLRLKNRTILFAYAKRTLLQAFIKSSQSFSKNLVAHAFSRIATANRSSAPVASKTNLKTPRASQSPTKILQVTEEIPMMTRQQTTKMKKDILQLQKKVKDQKARQQKQSTILKKSIVSLEQSKNSLQADNQQKTRTNQDLKTHLKLLPSAPQVPETQSTDDGAAQLSVLQQLYARVSHMNEQQFSESLPSLIAEFKVVQGRGRQTVQEWQLLGRKVTLQSQIDEFQRALLGGEQIGGGVSNIRQENGLVRCMIRNYVKERYLWSEVGRFVASVL